MAETGKRIAKWLRAEGHRRWEVHRKLAARAKRATKACGSQAYGRALPHLCRIVLQLLRLPPPFGMPPYDNARQQRRHESRHGARHDGRNDPWRQAAAAAAALVVAVKLLAIRCLLWQVRGSKALYEP